MPQWTTQGSVMAGQETDGEGETMGKSLYCGFHVRNQWVKVNRLKIE